MPLIILSFALLWLLFDEPVGEVVEPQRLLNPEVLTAQEHETRFSRVDFKGSVILVSMLCCLMFAISTGGSDYAWESPVIIGLLVISILLATAFIYVEKYLAKEPIIPVDLLTHRTIISAALTTVFATMTQYIIIYFTPVLFSSVYQLRPTQVGQRLVANFIGTTPGAMISGYYMSKTGRYYCASFIACVLISTGPLITILTGVKSLIVFQFLPLFVSGIGFAATLTITLVAFIAAVPANIQAVSTSLRNVSRGIGSTLGVSTAASIFNNLLKAQLVQHVKGPEAKKIIKRVLESVDAVNSLPESYRTPVLKSYDNSLKIVLASAAGIGLIDATTSLCMREYILDNRK